MKKIKYLLIFILSFGIFNSCLIDDETDLHLNAEGANVAAFNSHSVNLAALVDGTDKVKEILMKVVGPTVADLTSDITYTVAALATSTAVEGEHYRLDNPTITLTKANNYFGVLEVTLITEGNKPIEEGEPGYEDYIENYVAPVLELEVTNTSGDPKVLSDGKICSVTLSFMLFNPWAGVYDVEMRYFHPAAGGSYPPSVNPDDPYGGIRHYEKELVGESSKRVVTGFAIWGEPDLCWITFNDDGASIEFLVGDTWPYDVALGDPDDPSNVTHFDPVTRKIYMYYHYYGTGGARIFWEVFTPTF